MRKHLLFLSGLLALGISAVPVSGQHYTIAPNDTVRTEAVIGDYGKQYIFFHNDTIGGDEMILTWEALSYNFDTAAWSGTVCDYIQCYNHWVNGRTMEPIPSGFPGLISVQLHPTSATPALAEIVYRLQQQGFSTWDTVVFQFEVVTVGTDDANLNGKVAVSPNPASDELTLRGVDAAYASGEVVLYDLSGRRVRSVSVPAGLQYSFSISDLPEGLYVLRFRNTDGILTEKVMVMH